MMKYALYCSALFSLLLLSGCGGGSSEAPAGGEVHPTGWIHLHGVEATTDLRGCQGCHGFAFTGSGAAISCFTCHISGPPFSIHIASWTDAIVDHHDFALDLSWTSCSVAICHGTDLQGGNGPTCFDIACHTNTAGDPPAPASHQGVDFSLAANHGVAAKASQNFCLNCHGRPINLVDGGFIADPNIMNNLDFNGVAVFGNCTTCHPDAGAHPTNWQGSNDSDPTYSASHRGIDTDTMNQSCALCHNVVGAGISAVPAAPSCFSSNHTNANLITSACHPNGPRAAPHAVDGSYQAATAHGKDAKQDLTFCQGCHADQTASGPGSNPRFDSPIGNLINGCEDCHAAFYAHPSEWAGPNATFHYSAGNIANSCTLCHGTALDGVGGIDGTGASPGHSCLECHAETAVFTLDCTACHGFPPLAGDTIGADDFPPGTLLVDHTATTTGGTVVDKPLHDECATCHGVKNAAGSFDASANYLTFNKTTDTLGSHWNGSINMNGPSLNDPSGGAAHVGAGYNSTTFGCDNAGCHGPGFVLSNSNMPVEFADFGGGSGHAVGQSWLLRAGHVAAATAPSPACFSCHAQTGVSPVAGAPACQDCHVKGNPLVVLNCASCHTEPPSFASTATADRPDRAGKHGKHDALTIDTADCSACHTNGGSNSLAHFDRTAATSPDYPADIVFLGNDYDSQGSTAAYNAGAAACQNVICHGGVTTPNWYTGSINVYGGGTAGCQQCHSSAGEFNSYSSGEHDKHVRKEGISCTVCHSTTALQNGVLGNTHFSGLKTTAFELLPHETITDPNLNFDEPTSSCNPQAGGISGCHGSKGPW
jgi:hypothetical protein